MSVKLGEVTNILEKLAPLNYAYKWDNVGLQLGSKEDSVSRILIALEVTEAVLEEAIRNNVNMIITHHPMIFSSLKKIIKEDMKGKLIYKAIQNDIAIYAAHTNIDIAPGGLNDLIANKINLKEIQVLDITEKEAYYKLVVFVPIGHEEKVAEAINSAGAGHIGNYSHCSFRSKGTGTFKPLEGTNPFIGSHNNLEKVEEVRLETIVPKKGLNNVLSELMKAHPYEEVAYDIYPLQNEGPTIGIGRVGYLDEAKTLKELAINLKEQIDVSSVNVSGDLDSIIKKVAVINGSGADLITAALYKGCDCVITGDVKYHDAQDAIAQGINVIDIGHYHGEKFFPELLANYIRKEINGDRLHVEVIESCIDINPFKMV